MKNLQSKEVPVEVVTAEPVKEKIVTEPVTATDPPKTEKENFNAIVDFVPNQNTAIFSEPFGFVVGEIKDGTKVKITNRIDGPVTWFLLDNIGWITHNYIKSL
jgi:hypothetical protein